MNVNIKDMEDKKYIQLIGNLDGNSSNDVTEQVLDILNESNNIVIDMGKCPYVSSAGLRSLLTIGKTIKLNSGHMNIINLSEDVKEVMEITGFSGIFKGFED